MLLSCWLIRLIHLSIIILRHFIFTILFLCLDFGLFMSYLCDLFFIFSFIFIMSDHIIWYIHTHLCCLTFAWVFANFFFAKPVAHSSTSNSMTIISKKWEKYKMLKNTKSKWEITPNNVKLCVYMIVLFSGCSNSLAEMLSIFES